MVVAALRTRVDGVRALLVRSPLAARLAQGTFWSLIATVASRFLALPVSVLLARLLGKETFGQLGIVQSTVMTFIAFAGLGTGPTATKYVAELRDSDPARAGRVLALSAAVAWLVAALTGVALLLVAPWFAEHQLHAPHLTGALRVGTILLVFGATNGAQAGALSGLEAFKAVSQAATATGLVTLPLTLAGALLGGLSGALWGYAAAAIATWIVYHVLLRRELRRAGLALVWDGCFAESSVLLKFSVPALLAGFLVAPVTLYANVLLTRAPGGFGEVGVLNAAMQWRALLLFFPSTFGGVLLPVLTNLQGKGDLAAYRKTMKAGLAVTGAMAGGTAIAVSLAAGPIMASYGPAFRSGRTALVLVACAAVSTALTGVVGLVITSSGRMWLGLLVNAIWALTFVGASTYCVRWGANGIALAHLVAYAVHLVSTAVVAQRLVFHPAPPPAPAPAD